MMLKNNKPMGTEILKEEPYKLVHRFNMSKNEGGKNKNKSE